MSIYTRRGDGGETALFGGARVSKDDPRVEAYGTVDELNAVIGLLATEALTPADAEELRAVQSALLTVAGILADPTGSVGYDEAAVDPGRLERWIDRMDEVLEPLRRFVIPGGTRAAAMAHLARTVCRRAERRVRTVAREAGGVEPVLAYLNRLSDALFVLARSLNAAAGVADPEWTAPRS